MNRNNLKKQLCDEVSKITKKAQATRAQIQAREQELNMQIKETKELVEHVEKTCKAVTVEKSKLNQMEMKRIKDSQETYQIRELYYKREQDIRAIDADSADCELLCNRSSEILASDYAQQLEKVLNEYSKVLNVMYAQEECEVLELENNYNAEKNAREKEIRKIKNDEDNLDAEFNELKKKKLDMEIIFGRNVTRINAVEEEYQRLLAEITERKNKLNNEKSKLAEEEKCVTEELEKVEMENSDLLKEIERFEKEFEVNRDKSMVLRSARETEKEEEHKLQIAIENAQDEGKMLKLTEKLLDAHKKQMFENSSIAFGFKYDETQTEEDLEQCKTYLTRQFELLEEQSDTFTQFTETTEEKILELHKKNTTLMDIMEQANQQMEKLKSDRLASELEFNASKMELEQQMEKQNQELQALKERINIKTKILEKQEQEILEIKNTVDRQQAKFSEEYTKLDVELQKLMEGKATLEQQVLQNSTNLTQLKKECEDISNDSAMLKNKIMQLPNPKKENVRVQAHFRKSQNIDNDSNTSVECADITEFSKIIESYKKKKVSDMKK